MEDAAVDTILAARRAKRVLEPLDRRAPGPGRRLRDPAARGGAPRRGAARWASRSAPPRSRCRSISACPAPPPASSRAKACSPTAPRSASPISCNVGVECEVGVRLGRDLPPGPCTREQAADAVAEVHPAIEVVEKRYPADLATLGTPTLIADQVFHAAALMGAPVPDWRALDLGAVRGELRVNGAAKAVRPRPRPARPPLRGAGLARRIGRGRRSSAD